MGTVRKNQQGFGAVEAVLIIIVLALLGVIGWMVYGNHHKTDNANTKNTTAVTSSSAAPPNTTANPYAGWNTYTTKYQKLKFSYPTSWKLNDQTTTKGNGNDFLTLTASDGFILTFQAINNPIGAPSAESTLVSHTPVTFTGQPDDVLYYSDAATKDNVTSGPVDVAFLSSASDKLASPDAHESNTIWDISMSIATNATPVPITQLGSNADFQNALLILKSATY